MFTTIVLLPLLGFLLNGVLGTRLGGGRVGSKIHATYREDKTLLGGAVVRIGSTVYDGSLLAQLKQLKQKLVNA